MAGSLHYNVLNSSVFSASLLPTNDADMGIGTATRNASHAIERVIAEGGGKKKHKGPSIIMDILHNSTKHKLGRGSRRMYSLQQDRHFFMRGISFDFLRNQTCMSRMSCAAA